MNKPRPVPSVPFEEKKRLIIQGLGLLEKVPKHEIRVIHILNNLIVKIYETAAPVFGMNI